MKVVSLAPVPVASVAWRIGESPWVLSVVCKLTMKLEPGMCTLAKRNDPVHDVERFFHDDHEASVFAPCDLVPSRPLVDVSLVGDAYAPGDAASSSFTTRLSVANMDKRLHVEAEKPLRVASLAYEHGEGDGALSGRRGGTGTGRGHRLSCVEENAVCGYGPIASHWPERLQHLHGSRDPQPLQTANTNVLSPEFDLKFFNAAPPDQQLPELPPNAELLLENLDAKHAILRTRLPNVAPQIFVERAGRRKERSADISALWIDTRRSLLTVTWHSHIPLERLDQTGKVYVAVAGPGRRLNTLQLANLIGALGGSTQTPPAGPEDEQTSDDRDEDRLNDTVALRRKARRGDETLTSVLDNERFDDLAEHTADPANQTLDEQGPDWVGQRPDSVWPPAPLAFEAPPRSGAAPLPSETGSMPLPSQLSNTSTGTAVPNPRQSDTAPGPNEPLRPVVAPPPPPLRSPMATHPGIGPAVAPGSWMPRPPTPAITGVGDASDMPKPSPESEEPAAPAPRETKAPNEVVELLWHDPEATLALRHRWPELCDRLEFAPRDRRHDLPTRDAQRARDHHLHFGVITEAPTTHRGGLSAALRDAVSEAGRFTPPLVVSSGRLVVPFDDVEVLKATAAAIRPIAGSDKKLTDALEQAAELLDTPLADGSSDAVTNFIGHLRKIYGESRRSLSLEQLDSSVRRRLLTQRRYQKRTLFGGAFLRALFQPEGGSDSLPAYLPEALEKSLPMMSAFDARIVAEVHLRQDQFEPHRHALKVVTLGRIIRLSDE